MWWGRSISKFGHMRCRGRCMASLTWAFGATGCGGGPISVVQGKAGFSGSEVSGSVYAVPRQYNGSLASLPACQRHHPCLKLLGSKLPEWDGKRVRIFLGNNFEGDLMWSFMRVRHLWRRILGQLASVVHPSILQVPISTIFLTICDCYGRLSRGGAADIVSPLPRWTPGCPINVTAIHTWKTLMKARSSRWLSRLLPRGLSSLLHER